MPYVAPNSTIQYFDDLGLSPDHTDSLFFATPEAKNAYFDNLWFAQEEHTSYVYRNGKIRSGLPMSRLYTTAYIRFRNTSYENKWFYAFVTSIDYANNGLVEISFEIDVVMTWMGTFELGECFVERAHVRNDAIGANIADEGIAIGDYVVEDIGLTGYTLPLDIEISVSHTLVDDQPGGLSGGIYTGCYNAYYPTVEQANAAINALILNKKVDDIVSINMVPSHFAGDSVVAETHTVEKPYSDLDGYEPANNKLFCYPYKKLDVYNCEGLTKTYKYEYFNTVPDETSSGSCSFEIIGNAGINPQLMASPKNYKANSILAGYDDAISMVNFPTCAFSIDSYKAWLAQTKSNLPVSLVSSGLSAAAIGAVTGGIGYAAVAGSMIGTVANTLATGAMKQYEHDIVSGNQASDLMAGIAKDFYFIKRCITKNYAQMIDDYFSLFGYAIRQCIKPPMHNRQFYTYVKTIGCNVHGNVPSEDARAIEECFNNGIRFWTSHTNIGKAKELAKTNVPIT